MNYDSKIFTSFDPILASIALPYPLIRVTCVNTHLIIFSLLKKPETYEDIAPQLSNTILEK